MPKNSLWVKKCDFFKVQDNDTTIRLGEKEHQTDVSSALKMFRTTTAVIEKISNFPFFDTTLTIFLDFCTEMALWMSQNPKIEIFLITAVVVLKPFQGRTNISLMFLFPRLDCGIIISNFEKITFFASMAIFGLFSPSQKAFFAARTLLKIPLLFEKKSKKWKFFCGFFRKTSKLSGSVFSTSWDRIVAQKSYFRKKKSKNVVITIRSPG